MTRPGHSVLGRVHGQPLPSAIRGFYELGKADRLDDPSLRDMWLIWGETLIEEDLRDVA